MTGGILVDTNVLVYAYDRSEPVKQKAALAIMDRLVANDAAVISAQVLSEFFAVTTRRVAAVLSVDAATAQVAEFLRGWTVLDLTGLVVLEATRGVREFRLSYWDALIWATARLNQIAVIFSEDLPGRSEIEGIRVVNPFAADFKIEEWV